jgi:hypothetical protein
MPKIILKSYPLEVELRRVGFIKFLRDEVGLPLSLAKEYLEEFVTRRDERRAF